MSVTLATQYALNLRPNGQSTSKTDATTSYASLSQAASAKVADESVKLSLSSDVSEQTQISMDEKIVAGRGSDPKLAKFQSMREEAMSELELHQQKLKAVTKTYADEPRKLARELHRLGRGVRQVLRSFQRAENAMARLTGGTETAISSAIVSIKPGIMAYQSAAKNGCSNGNSSGNANEDESLQFAGKMVDFAKELKSQLKQVEKTAHHQKDQRFLTSGMLARIDAYLDGSETLTKSFEKELRFSLLPSSGSNSHSV